MDRQSLTSTTQALGISTALVMSGFYFSTSWVGINPLVPLPISQSTSIFTQVFETGGAFVVPLALSSTALNAAAAYLTARRRYTFAIASLAAISTLGFTAAFMLGGIGRLVDISKMDGSQIQGVRRDEVVSLLLAWKRQNYVRAALSFISGMVGLFAVFN